MVELVIMACLVTQPQRCQEFHVPSLQPIDMAQCLTQSQLSAMRWAVDHPDWVIRRWRCGAPEI